MRVAMRTPRISLHLLILAFVACSGGGGSCSGCGGCLTPLPNGFTGTRLNGSVTARVTQDGFTFINSNWAALLPGLGVTNPIPVPVACSNVSFGSDGHLCDQNRNDNCDPGEQCNVTVNIVKVKIDPATAATNQGLLKASAELQIRTGDMWMRTCAASVFGACVCRLTCSAES
jgi:hypothetical protein